MFKTCWDVLVLFATIYVAIMVPYNASFPDSNSLMLAELDSSQIFGIVRTFKKAKINGFLIFFPMERLWIGLRREEKISKNIPFSFWGVHATTRTHLLHIFFNF